MGVKDLWNILDPAAESCTLADLCGKCLAVDISGWIFQSKEAQALTGKDSFHPHLRTLFWRLYHLTRNQVRLVVVFDGRCPDIKLDAVQKRKNKPSVTLDSPGKSKFQSCVEECKELLSTFKIPYLVADGDGEALCAQLNQQGVVDGCITEDCDAFLFGARTVYRHFSCDPNKANDLKCYKMETVKQKLNLGRDHLVALALLLGCDYGLGGVRGIGKEHAVKLFQLWGDDNPLEKMQQWRLEKGDDKASTFRTSSARKPVHCRQCGHEGSGDSHALTGCDMCNLKDHCKKIKVDSVERVCHCSWHENAALQQSYRLEAKIKEAALKDPGFPKNELIKQYLAPMSPYNMTLDWPRPLYAEVEKYLQRLFKWDQKKIRDQLSSFYTAHDMSTLIRTQVSGDSYPEGFARPEKILALKHEHHREVYVVEWRRIPGLPIPEGEKLTTSEFKENFSAAYPQVAANFEGWLTHNSTPMKSPSRKRRLPQTPEGQQTTMDRFCVARKRLFLPHPTAPAAAKDN